MNPININWQERFEDMHVDTKSTLKNIIRLDWTENSILEKEYFNREIDSMIGDLIDEQSDYNKLIERFNSEKTAKDLKTAKKITEESERDPSSLQCKMLDCKNKLQNLEHKFREQKEASRGKIPMYVSPTIVDSHTGSLDKEISYYNNIIINCRKEIYKYQAKLQPVINNVNLLNNEISKLNKDISTLEEHKSELKERISRLDKEISNLNNPESVKNLESSYVTLYQMREERSKLTDRTTELTKEKLQKENIKSQKENELNQLKIKQDGYQKIIANFENELNRVKEEVCKKNDQKINNVYKDLKTFYDKNSTKIDSLINKLGDFLKSSIIAPARKGGVVNSSDVVNLMQRMKNVEYDIRDTKRLISNINLSEGYDSGAFKGFYTFLSTKKKRLYEINSQISEVRHNIEKSNSSLASIENAAQNFALGSENRIDSNGIRLNVEKFLKDVESVSDEMLKFQNEFDSRFKSIIPAVVFKIEYEKGKICKISEGIIKH